VESKRGSVPKEDGTMNKKQKILTVIALAVFAGIIAGHYSSPNGRYGFYPSDYGWFYLDLSASGKYGFIPDVRLPIFALAVFYAGLFLMRRRSRGPRHDEFQARTLWTLFNSFTEVLKGNLNELPRRTEALHGLLDSYVGLPQFSQN
jgi:hypothetical protein